ncbi:hypothetical protein F0L74_10295 [Chitinophaga agrisoli]|uniref:Uncharacterized protein n=1 Tax=Chitinophaga agrisoli TaxID=2607653 RepID=A0A5B2VXZ9_9BACT|nr:hypothetical protein [Chitinophaga agrisoli]KAA2242909.1 hypothetical protein F0L74_10295 [Chitinophaga agrisoli]
MKVMPVRDRSIGNQGLEQGGPNMGNDYSRNITRETQVNDSDTPVVGKNKKKAGKTATSPRTKSKTTRQVKK